MKHSQLAANNSSSFRSSSIRRPSNSFRSFGISVIGKSSGVGVALLSTCFFLQGCAAGSSSNNPPLDPATVAIVAPASGAVVTALPVPITLNLMNGATLSGMKITLNGTDITGSFVAGNGNTARASLSGRTYVGNNRIQVVIGSQTVKSQFTYNPGSTGTAGSMGPPSSGSSATLSDVIPIQTRVQMTNELGQQTMGVQVGEAAYPAPGVQLNTTGFQVVWLRRSDLKMVSNASYSVVDDASATAFANEITPSATQVNYCGIAGCIEVIQSLSGIGYNPCFGDGNAIACVNYRLAFQNIGGTLIIPNVPQNDPGNLAYSLIGNIGSTGLHPGSSYERVTCASSDGCIQPTPPGSNSNTVLYGIAPNGVDGVMPNLANTGSSGTTTISATAFMPQMTISNNGAMAGEFVLDNTNNFTFAYADPPISFQMGVAPDNPNKNLLTLTIPSGSQMTFPNGNKTQAGESGVLPANDNGAPVGGFHLVAFDAVTFKNLVNGTYTVSPFPSSCPQVAGTDYCIGPDGTPIYRLDQLQSDILRLNSRGVILFLASIGNLNHNYVGE